MTRLRRLTLAAAALLQIAIVAPVICPAIAQTQPTQSFDVLIYGGTAGGVVAAVSAASAGLHATSFSTSRTNSPGASSERKCPAFSTTLTRAPGIAFSSAWRS